MKRDNVFSSTLKSMGYEGNVLEIEFKTGRVYQYKDVPFEVFQQLRIAPSIGKDFNEIIVRGGFEYKRVDIL